MPTRPRKPGGAATRPRRTAVFWCLVALSASVLATAAPARAGSGALGRPDARAAVFVAPRVRPAAPLPGELVTFSGSLGSSVERTARLQRLASGRWRTVSTAQVPTSGRYSFVVHARARPGRWRVLAASTRVSGHAYGARHTAGVTVAVAEQSVTLDAPAAVVTGTAVRLTAHLRPLRPGRRVTLRSSTAGAWTTLGTGVEDATGTVRLTARAPATGWLAWDAVARAEHGAAAYVGPAVRTAVLPSRPVQIAAHAGGAKDFPVDSLEAVRNAIGSSTDWVELDLRPTADGDWVLFHDSDLRRTTNIDATPLASRDTDRVEQFTLAELKTLDAGSWKSPRFACGPDAGPLDDCRIPTLDQLVDTVDAAESATGHHVRLLLEFKSDGVDDRADMDALVDRVRALRPSWVGPGHADKALFLSFDYATVFDDLRHDTDGDGRPVAELVPLLSAPSQVAGAPTAWAAMIDLALPLIHPDTAGRLRSAGAPLVGAWTADRPADLLDMGALGVDVVTTDDVTTARSVLLR